MENLREGGICHCQIFREDGLRFMVTKPVKLYTDHGSPILIFAPATLRPNAPRYPLAIVHGWAVHVSRFKFVIEHIEGVKNVLADLLTRCSEGSRTRESVCVNVALLCQSGAPESTNLKEITMKRLKYSQKEHNPFRDAIRNAEGFWELNDRTWLPD